MLLLQQILDVNVLTSANIGTDQQLILGKMWMVTPLKKKKPTSIIEEFNIESFTNETTELLYSVRCKNQITQYLKMTPPT